MRHEKLNILTLATYSIHSMGAFNSLHWGILLTLLGHLKLLMLALTGHVIDSVGHLKLNILTPHGEFNSLRQGILLSPSGHLKLNLLTPVAHLIHSDGHFIVSVGAFNSL